MTTQREIGYVESIQRLKVTQQRWAPDELLRAIKNAELRNTGWPVGIVLNRSGESPVVTQDGIEARVGDFAKDLFDYWRFDRDGTFYFLRKFEEDTERLTGIYPPPPEYTMWWDIRIWRIAEILLHSAVLYRELGVEGKALYQIHIRHAGLSGREWYVSRPASYFTRGGAFSKAGEAEWEREVTQDQVLSSLGDIVEEVSRELFVLFDFQRVPRETINKILDSFLGKGRT